MSYQYASINYASPQQVDERVVNANRLFFNNLLGRQCYIGWKLEQGIPTYDCRLCKTGLEPGHEAHGRHVQRMEEYRRICWEGDVIPSHREISNVMDDENGRRTIKLFHSTKKANKTSSEYNGCVMSMGYLAFRTKQQQQRQQYTPIVLPPIDENPDNNKGVATYNPAKGEEPAELQHQQQQQLPQHQEQHQEQQRHQQQQQQNLPSKQVQQEPALPHDQTQAYQPDPTIDRSHAEQSHGEDVMPQQTRSEPLELLQGAPAKTVELIWAAECGICLKYMIEMSDPATLHPTIRYPWPVCDSKECLEALEGKYKTFKEGF